MSKVQLTIELDIPGIEQFNEAQQAQLLFDAYVNYATIAHSRDALNWLAKAKTGTKDEVQSRMHIHNYHNSWTDICRSVEWYFKVLDEAKIQSKSV